MEHISDIVNMYFDPKTLERNNNSALILLSTPYTGNNIIVISTKTISFILGITEEALSDILKKIKLLSFIEKHEYQSYLRQRGILYVDIESNKWVQMMSDYINSKQRV